MPSVSEMPSSVIDAERVGDVEQCRRYNVDLYWVQYCELLHQSNHYCRLNCCFPGVELEQINKLFLSWTVHSFERRQSIKCHLYWDLGKHQVAD
ncbi:uncharacterized protein YALI1_A14292g [Yarrowia lipolytica]|uniref:Uncharacterized protein n=1 Tax=Yarrowia lipolytica TaxID=4952 RepID=A0A1D8N4S3_YARLL|nr:hypothetical protein YALI1_A14292g [Yarrowia lipolytica]